MFVIDELKRRNVFRVGIAYLATGWLLIQLVETLFPIFGLPDAKIRLVVILLTIGLPIVLVFSWLYELTPDGLKRDKDVDRSVSQTHHTGKKMDRAIMVVLALAIGYFAFDKFVLDPARDATLEESIEERVRDEMLVGSYGDKSIAVLPFVNMSDDANNEYFSDGISEEVLNLLAEVSQLRVISRSSAFSFRDRDMTVPAIAEQLNVGHVLEGSVRKVGNTVRITAQLIEAHTDTHLWSETYDRKLDDVFAVQDEIAAVVVEKLKVTLLGDAPQARPTNPEAYELYLQARHVGRQQTIQGLEHAEELFKKSLAIDPNYAQSWIGLGILYTNQVFAGSLSADEGFRLAQEVTEKVLELDPYSAAAYEGLSWLANKRDNDLSKAASYLQRALELGPNDIDVLAGAARLLQDLGRLREASIVAKYVVTRDPVNPVAYNNLGALHLFDHDMPQARESFLKLLMLSPDYAGARYLLGLTELLMDEAEAALKNFEVEPDNQLRLKGRALAYHALGRDQEANEALEELIDEWGEEWPPEIAHVFAYRGEMDSAFRYLANEHEDSGGWGEGKLNPLFDNLHADSRWEEFLENLGVSDTQLATIEFQVTLPDQ
jgi:adenylate cyclase